MPDEVEQFYGQSAEDEWNRLERHRMEFAVTLRALSDYLPPVPARVLDIGGGPGRYAITLAQQGYTVTLFDLSAPLLDFAHRKAAEMGVTLAGYEHGTATDLSRFPPENFDAALLMGPLYHLLEPEERQQAVREAYRIIRPGGLIFATFITRYAPIRDMARKAPHRLIERWAEHDRIITTGQYQLAPGGGFTSAYFAHPTEVIPLMTSGNFATLDLIGCEGITSMIEDQLNEAADEVWETWVDLNYRLSKDPCTHGGAEHLLYIGQRLEEAAGQ